MKKLLLAAALTLPACGDPAPTGSTAGATGSSTGAGSTGAITSGGHVTTGAASTAAASTTTGNATSSTSAGATTTGGGTTSSTSTTAGSTATSTSTSGGGAERVVINEICGKHDNWVELYNPTSQAQDVSGYAVTDSEDGGAKLSHAFVFPAGTTVAPGGYLMVVGSTDGGEGGPFPECIDVGGPPCFLVTWGISNSSGDILFYLREDLTVIEAETYPANTVTTRGQTWGRLPSATGSFQVTTATPGAANQP
jgi:hypothetical protein